MILCNPAIVNPVILPVIFKRTPVQETDFLCPGRFYEVLMHSRPYSRYYRIGYNGNPAIIKCNNFNKFCHLKPGYKRKTLVVSRQRVWPKFPWDIFVKNFQEMYFGPISSRGCIFIESGPVLTRSSIFSLNKAKLTLINAKSN